MSFSLSLSLFKALVTSCNVITVTISSTLPMACNSRLRAVVLLLAKMSLIGPIGHFIVEAILRPRFPMGDLDKQVGQYQQTEKKEGIKVIACGFCRSGTLSLKAALDRLGFKCYHGFHVYADGGRHIKLWSQAASDAKWDEWELILQGYSAIADFPAACFYKRLMAAYPNAKVIMNVRDPDRWYRSCMETVSWLRNKLFFQVFRGKAFTKFVDDVLWKGQFDGRFEEREFAISVYKRHVEEVKRIVPKEKLLVFELKDGWAPMCGFLQVDVPDEPFPFINDGGSFKVSWKRRERVYALFSAIYVGFICCALALLLECWRFHL